MTTALKLNVKFNDKSISPHTLDLLAESATKIIWEYFSEKIWTATDGTARIPCFYTEKQLDQKIFDYAKSAFDRHKTTPYPDDDVQLLLKRIDLLTVKPLARDLGPSATDRLHPVIKFEQG